jgi:hypothetical protein
MTLQSGLLLWPPPCPALFWTQTAELTPRASGPWISDLTALPAFPSFISLSLPLLSTWPTPQTRWVSPSLRLPVPSLSLVSEVAGALPGMTHTLSLLLSFSVFLSSAQGENSTAPPAYYDQRATRRFCSPCLSHLRETRSWPRSILAWRVNSPKHLPRSLSLPLPLSLSLSVYIMETAHSALDASTGIPSPHPPPWSPRWYIT